MDAAATLAFFQSFYADAPLYVVAEPAAPAAPPASAEAAPLASAPPAAAAASAETPAAPVVAATPALAVPPATTVPRPLAEAAPAPQVVPAVAPGPAVAEPPHQPRQATVAQLPAAAPAPAGRVQPTPTQSPVAHIPFSTLGSNPNGLIILVRLTPEEFRKLPRNVFLNNLLKAIRLIMEDVVLVNVEHPSYPVALCTLRQTMGARQFLAFGKNLLDVAVYTTQPYEPVLLFGDTAFLGAGEISMLEYDAGRKKQLWQAIQRMFRA